MATSEIVVTVVAASLGSAGLWTLINNIYLNHSKENKTIELMKAAQLATLQDRLLYLCTKYLEDYKDTGIEANQLKSLHNLYKSYTDLGGNSFISDMMDRVNKLKVR